MILLHTIYMLFPAHRLYVQVLPSLWEKNTLPDEGCLFTSFLDPNPVSIMFKVRSRPYQTCMPFPTHVRVSIFRVFHLTFQVSSHAETFSQDLGWPPFSSRYEIMYALHAISHSPSSIIFSLSLLSLVYRPQPDLYRVSGTELLTLNMHAISHSPLRIGF